MPGYIRTDSDNTGFIRLVKELDTYLAMIDGEEHGFYNQFNNIDVLKQVVLAFENNEPIGCGAIKAFDTGAMEVKRMYVAPDYRGRGIAREVLKQLEAWAKELGYQKTILETGRRQAEAIALYTNTGYSIIPNYGQYAGVANSVCFEKIL